MRQLLTRSLSRALVLLAAGSTISGVAAAQCDPHWVAGVGAPGSGGLTGTVLAAATLPDGDIVMAGAISTAGVLPVHNIGRYRPSTKQWSMLTGAVVDGIDGVAYAMTVTSNGKLIIGGSFTHAAGGAAGHIVMYDPVSGGWNPMGAGVVGNVTALYALDNGKVLVGGQFITAGGVPCKDIALLDPDTGFYSPLGLGVDGPVYAIASLPDGDIIAAGLFFNAGGNPATRIARFHPASGAWSALAEGIDGVGAEVHALALLPNGQLMVGGYFSSAGDKSVYCVARYDTIAKSWIEPAEQVGAKIWAFAPTANGDVYAIGDFIGSQPGWHVGLYHAATDKWTALGAGLTGAVTGRAITLLPNGDPIFAGSFSTAGNNAVANFAQWTNGNVADVNQDGELDLNDFFEFFNDFDASAPGADMNQDASVDLNDFFQFFNAWDLGC